MTIYTKSHVFNYIDYQMNLKFIVVTTYYKLSPIIGTKYLQQSQEWQ